MTRSKFKYTCSFIIASLICFQTWSQTIKDPDEFLLPSGAEDLPQIFLVGIFHFAYPNKDATMIEKSDQIDILTKQKQEELKELLDYISLFKPTKICVEAPEDWKVYEKYKKYKSGRLQLERDEKEQIGFRLVEKFGLDTIYSIDANSIANDLMNDTCGSKITDKIFKDYNKTQIVM